MSYAMMRSACSLYSQTSAQGSVEGADRHQLIGMLLDGLIDLIHQAGGNILHGDVPAKGKSFSRAVAILNELRESLDHAVEPTLTRRLDSLYDYVTRRLLHAQLNNDLATLDECQRLIAPVREAWQSIRQDFVAQQESTQVSR